MNLLVPCVVILLLLGVITASEGHGIQQGLHHLKKLWKERVLTTVGKGKLLKKAAKRNYTRHKLKEKVNDEIKRNKAYVELAKINALLKSKLKRPVRKHHRSYSLINKKSPVQFLAERPSDEPKARARKLRSRFMPLANRPSADFDEEVNEEIGSTRDTIQDETSFQESRKSENDPDSDEPIADDSDEGKESDKPALVSSVPVTKAHHHGADKGDMVLVRHDDGHVAEEKESPVQEQIDNKQNEEETTASEDDEDDEDKDDEGQQPDDEENDDIVEKQSHSTNKMKQEPMPEMSISQARMPNIENKQDRMNAVAERERQLQRLRKFFAQEKQQILRRLWLNYENTIDRNTAAQPSQQHISPLAWGYPTGLPNAYLLLVPTVPVYQPAAFTESEPPAIANESSDKDTDNQGYSISVDGLKGVFSKEPGLVVRFHSPNSEVTVTKRRNEVMRLVLPINDHR